MGSFTRKAAHHFVWDWGPRFVTMGIWKPVYLKFYNEAKINHVLTETKEINEDYAIQEFHIEIESSHAKPANEEAPRIACASKSIQNSHTNLLIDLQ